MHFTWKYFWVVFFFFFFWDFPLDLLYFPPYSALWHLPAGAGFCNRWSSYWVNTAVILAKTPVDESGRMTQSWLLIAGFALDFLALRSFFSSKKRVRSHCWMLFLSGEAAALCVPGRVSGHKASLHLLLKAGSTGRGQRSLPGHCWCLHPSSQHGLQGEHRHGINSMGVWGSSEESFCRLRNCRSVAVTCESTLDVRVSVRSGSFQRRSGSSKVSSSAVEEWLPGLHKEWNGRVTLSDKASFIVLWSYFLTLAAQALMNQPHLLPTSHFSEGDFKKKS